MKGKGNKGDSKGWTAGKGWSEGKGWNTSSKGWEKQRPSGMNNLERDSKQYDVLVMETSILEKNRERTPVTVPVKHVAKLSRMRGSTEDGDNDTTPDCVGSKQLALEGRCQLQCNCCEDEWHAVEANAKSLHQKAKCTFFQLDRCRHQFLREGQYGPVRASTKHLGAVAKAPGCRFRSWRNRYASGLVDKPSFDRGRRVKSK